MQSFVSWENEEWNFPDRVSYHEMRGYADLLGGKIISIDGHPIDEVLARLEQLRGGTPQWRRAWAQIYISWQDVLVGAGVAPEMGHSTWIVTSPSGKTVTRILTPYKASEDEPDVFVNRIYSPEPLKELGTDWVAYQPGRQLPVTFSDFNDTFRRVRLPRSCAMLIEFRSNDDVGNSHIMDFEAATKPICRRTSRVSSSLTTASMRVAT